MKNKCFKIISILLSICVFTAAFFGLPINASATGSEPTVNENGITFADIAAGLATPYDYYGEIPPETIPDAVGTQAAYERTHIERLYAEEEDSLNNVIFKNADGTNTMYLFDYPVKYVDDYGRINDISLEIAPDIARPGYYKNVAHSLQTTFSQNAADGINLSDDNVSITLIPLGASSVDSGAIALQSTAAQVNNKTVSYTYNNKTTLEYSLTYRGFKEDIVVKEYTGQTEYHFTLLTGGLTLKKIGETFCLTDQHNNIRATIGDIIIFTADEKNNTFGRLTFETVKAMQEYRMTIHVDGDYLRDENTAYPIRIDPTIELNYTNYGAGAIHDVTLNSNYTSDTNSTALSIGRRSNTYGISRVLMKFPGLNLDVIKSASGITSASVEIRDILCESSALTVSCYAFTGNEWNESTVRWSNVDADNLGAFQAERSISYSNGTQQTSYHRYSFTITDVVKGWKAGNYSQEKGIIFKAPDSVEDGTTSNYKTIASYNRSEYRPSVSVTYTNAESDGLDFSGLYYINNMNSGYYLYRGDGNTNVHGERGSLDAIISKCTWRIDKVDGGYIIRNSSNLNQYLGVLEQSGYIGVRRITLQDTVIPNSCKWNITLAATGGCLIRNKYNSNYLYTSSNNTYTTSTLGSSTDYDVYTPKVWRIIRTDQITKTALNQSSYTNDGLSLFNELNSGTVFHGRDLMVNDSSIARYTKSSKFAIWSEPSDFIYSGYDSSIISIDYNGKITAKQTVDVTTVTALHKPTGITENFTVSVCASYPNLGSTISTWNNIEGDRVAHWANDNLPQYIFVSSDGNDDLTLITPAIQYAIDLWNNALSLNMTLTSNINDADIVIEAKAGSGFSNHPDLSDLANDSAKLGLTNMNYSYEGYYTHNTQGKKIVGIMTEATVGIAVDRITTQAKARWTVMHELGHALGYIGHSGTDTDVLYYKYNTNNLSSAEISHLKQIYDKYR